MERDVFVSRIDAITALIGDAAASFYRISREQVADDKRESVRVAFRIFKDAQDMILAARLHVEDERRTASSSEQGRLNYQILAFTELANTLLWALIGEDAFTTALSADLPTHVGDLRFQNIESCINAASTFNKEPDAFAFIADLAAGANIGDLVVSEMDATGKLGLRMVELKEGTVNMAILDLHRLEAEEPSNLPTAVQAFEEAFGESGRKQFERVGRQMQRAANFLELVTKDELANNKHGGTRYLHTLPTSEESHSAVINALLDDFYANRRDFGWIQLDHVYYGFLALSPENNQLRYQLDFRHYVYHDVREGWEACCFADEADQNKVLEEMKAYSRLPMFELRNVVQMPFLRPLLLTGLQPKYAADVIGGRLGVLIHVHNSALIDAMKEGGLDVTLSPSGYGQLDDSLYRVDGKFLKIRLPDKHDTEIAIGNKAVFRTIFSFQTLPNFIQRLLDSTTEHAKRWSTEE